MTSNSTYYGYDYFCGANVFVNINGLPALETAGISYQVQDSTSPIYGYSSRIFDAVAIGQKIIRGSMIINFIQPHYLSMLVERGRGIATKKLVDEEKLKARISNEYKEDREKLDSLKKYIEAREQAYQQYVATKTYSTISRVPTKIGDDYLAKIGTDPYALFEHRKRIIDDPMSSLRKKPEPGSLFLKKDGTPLTGREVQRLIKKKKLLYMVGDDGKKFTGFGSYVNPIEMMEGELKGRFEENYMHVYENSLWAESGLTPEQRTEAASLSDSSYQQYLKSMEDARKLYPVIGGAEIEQELGLKGVSLQGQYLKTDGYDSYGKSSHEEENLEKLKKYYKQQKAELKRQEKISEGGVLERNKYYQRSNELSKTVNDLKTASNKGGARDAMIQLDAIEKAYTDFYGEKEVSAFTSDVTLTTDIGLLGPFNIDIHFGKSYTIRIIDAFFTSRGSMIQIDENAIVEEYSFFARDIKSITK